MKNVKEIVVRITAEKLGHNESKIKETSRFVDDLGADSLDQVELIMAFEDEFYINIDDNDIEGIKSISEAVVYIEKKTAEKNHGN